MSGHCGSWWESLGANSAAPLLMRSAHHYQVFHRSWKCRIVKVGEELWDHLVHLPTYCQQAIVVGVWCMDGVRCMDGASLWSPWETTSAMTLSHKLNSHKFSCLFCVCMIFFFQNYDHFHASSDYFVWSEGKTVNTPSHPSENRIFPILSALSRQRNLSWATSLPFQYN